VVVTWAKTAALAPGTAGAAGPSVSGISASPATTGDPSDMHIPEQQALWAPNFWDPPSVAWPNCPTSSMPSTPTLTTDHGLREVTTMAWPVRPYKDCPSGTLSLQATSDGSHWKSLGSKHIDVSVPSTLTIVSDACLVGTWTYQSSYVADDGTYVNSHTATITC
jgi:hypothetical protein